MARPRNCRRINGMPDAKTFKPAGVPASALEQVSLGLDELEALRLADLEGLYQDEAARRMNVSRQTFGRIVAEARRKTAEALIEGRCLIIEGGNVEMADMRAFKCYACGHAWEVPFGTGRPQACPTCNSENIHHGGMAGAGRGFGGRCRRRRLGKNRDFNRQNAALGKGAGE